MTHFDLGTVGAPETEHRHHHTRQILSIVAAVAGALAALVVGGLIVTGAGATTWAWLSLPILVVVWLSGFVWRWDSPDRRKKTDERERRGF